MEEATPLRNAHRKRDLGAVLADGDDEAGDPVRMDALAAAAADDDDGAVGKLDAADGNNKVLGGAAGPLDDGGVGGKRRRVRPEGIHFNWGFELTPRDVIQSVESLIKRVRVLFDAIGSMNPDETTYDNVAEALDVIDNLSSMEYYPLTAARHFGICQALSRASTEASKRWNEFEVEMSMRKDVFRSILEVNRKLLETRADLSEEQKKYMDKLIFDRKRIGLHLKKRDRKIIETLSKDVEDFNVKFRQNLDENKLTLQFKPEELAGTPEVTLKTMEKTKDGKYVVTMKNPHVRPILQSCTNAETRKTVLAAYFSRCSKENGPILQKMLDLRHRKAQMLGYRTHADYILEDRMAKNTRAVDDFLYSLAKDLAGLWSKERQTWIRHKISQQGTGGLRQIPGRDARPGRLERRITCCCTGNHDAAFIADWDYSFLENLSNVKDYHVDHKLIQEYFPTEKVVPGVLKIFEKILCLKFDEVVDAEKWHDSVKLYQVTDAKSKEKMGYFFLDLYPREGKYDHAAMFELQPRWKSKKGETFHSVSAVLTNFTPPSATMPSLLTHGELTTFFHEFGHVMHEICRRNKYFAFNLSGVDIDFVEAPSQMLENWAWEPEILKKLSSHHKTGKSMPDDMIDSLVKSKSGNAGGTTLRRIVMSLLDQEIHSGDGKRDPVKIHRDLQKALLDIEPIKGSNVPAHFGHMADGYDASYYGYLWSEVYSADMYHSTFKKKGIMDPEIGLRYRNIILAPGGSRDPRKMLEEFLGRKPSNVPFLRSKGINV